LRRVWRASKTNNGPPLLYQPPDDYLEFTGIVVEFYSGHFWPCEGVRKPPEAEQYFLSKPVCGDNKQAQ
jgi:hypothetical protein